MRQPTVRIYLTANLAVCLLFTFMSFPEGLGIGIIASLYSAVFSAPTLLVLYGCFSLLERYDFGRASNWFLLLIAASLCAFIPVLIMSLFLDGNLSVDKDFLLLSFGSAFTGISLQAFYINKYFKSLRPETNVSHENN
jgi:uncharacterized membrane-anchored protein